MGLSDYFTDVISSLGFAEAQAEAPQAEGHVEQETEQNTAAGEEESAKKAEESPAETQEAEEEPEEEGEAEEEEEDEEPEDIKPKLEEECAHSSICAPFKHHYDECVERVTRQQEDPDHKGPKEDCIEEFFHLTHCATQCAAPQLWKSLK